MINPLISFLDLAVIFGFLVLIWNLALNNAIPFWVVVIVTIFFVCAIPFRLTARLLGGAFGSLIRLAFTIGMPVLSFILLAVRFGYGDIKTTGILFMLLTCLYLTILGVYIMVWGAFAHPAGITWSTPILLSIVVFVMGLALGGYISAEAAAIFMVVLALFYGTTKILSPGESQTVRRTFTVGLPLAGLVILMFFSGNKEIVISLLTVIIVFYILYLFLRNIFNLK